MGVYYANLSIVQFRAIMLGIHVYVYIDYMVMNIEISCVRQLIKPNIVLQYNKKNFTHFNRTN